MICTNCKATIKDDSKYCIRCGYVIENYNPTKEDLLERKLFDSYTRGEKIKNGTSWLCFFLSFIYLFYKKMYAEGLFCLISISILSFFIPNFFGLILNSLGFYLFITVFVIIICAVIIIFYARNYSELYTRMVTCEINKIIVDNQEKSEEELIEMCRKKGKPNLILAIVSPILFLINTYIVNIILTSIFF